MADEPFIKRELLDGQVELVSCNPAWPILFEQQAGLIRKSLGSVALAIEHVGSTSVPGLAAKPVLDIALTVKDSSREEDYAPALEAHGFELFVREPDWFAHRMFKHFSPRTNLHVFSEGCSEVERLKLFRDWLRADETDRAHYEKVKRELAALQWVLLQDYADAKTGVVKEILQRAAGDRPQT